MKVAKLPEGFVPRTILVIRDSRVGDVLMATPTIRRLKECFPAASIDVLTSRYAKRSGVLDRNPCVHRVFSCAKNRVLKWLRCLALPRYDLVVPIRKRSTFGRIRVRYTLDGVDSMEDGANSHVVQRSQIVLGELRATRVGPMEIYPTDEETRLASQELSGREVGVYPSCHGSSIGKFDNLSSRRVWRREQVLETVQGLEDAGYEVVLFGGNEAEELALQQLGLEVPILCGGTITHLAARLGRLRALISVDTGPMHVAAAMDTPLVALFGPTRPEVTGPWSKSGRNVVLQDSALSCCPCRGNSTECSDNVCMLYHTPSRILEALRSLGVDKLPTIKPAILPAG